MGQAFVNNWPELMTIAIVLAVGLGYKHLLGGFDHKTWGTALNVFITQIGAFMINPVESAEQIGGTVTAGLGLAAGAELLHALGKALPRVIRTIGGVK